MSRSLPVVGGESSRGECRGVTGKVWVRRVRARACRGECRGVVTDRNVETQVAGEGVYVVGRVAEWRTRCRGALREWGGGAAWHGVVVEGVSRNGGRGCVPRRESREVVAMAEGNIVEGTRGKGRGYVFCWGGVVYGYVVVEASIAEWEGSYGSSVVLREMSWNGGRWYVMEGILWLAVSGVFNI